jgi:hypothetical protein
MGQLMLDEVGPVAIYASSMISYPKVFRSSSITASSLLAALRHPNMLDQALDEPWRVRKRVPHGTLAGHSPVRNRSYPQSTTSAGSTTAAGGSEHGAGRMRELLCVIPVSKFTARSGNSYRLLFAYRVRPKPYNRMCALEQEGELCIGRFWHATWASRLGLG